MLLAFGRGRNCLSLPCHSGKIICDDLNIKQNLKDKQNKLFIVAYYRSSECSLQRI